MGEQRPAVSMRTLGALVVAVACLYLARPILVPIALAILLTFVLNPLVNLLRRVGLGRGPAALVVVLLAALVALGIGWGLFVQVSRLADELPQYRSNISRKIADLRQARRETLSKVEQSAKELLDEIQKVAPPAEPKVPVVVDRGDGVGARFRLGLIEGLTSAGLVILLLLFMLTRQPDLRDRIIRLFGPRRVTETTQALDEAAARVTRYLLAHGTVNASFAIAVSAGLALIGVPYALVWGGLGGVLRFIPYAGVWIAMGLPVLMSLAVFDGWWFPLLVVGLFAVIEIAMVFAVEPLLYGKSVGVSEVALIVAVAFWIWLWGPIGLVLAAPLTVCVVVFARHIPALDFLTILMSDEPAIEPELGYYQRLLARDRAEAGELLEARLESATVTQVVDEMLLPALTRARHELDAGRLGEEEHAWMVAVTARLVEDVVAPAGLATPDRGRRAPAPVIVGCPARDAGDEVALRCLQLLVPSLEIVPPAQALAAGPTRGPRPRLVCISAGRPGGGAQARHLCRRLRATVPTDTIVVGRWGDGAPDDGPALVAAGAHHVVSTLDAMVRVIERALAEAAPARLATGSAP